MLNDTEKILERLAAADRVHQKEAGGRFLLQSLKYAGAALLGAFALDVVFHLRAGWRVALLLAMFGGVAAAGAAGWWLAFVRRNRLEHIGRLLESREPTLGSRLINLLQLRQQTSDASLSALTRELARQAVEGYATELRGLPLEELARTDDLRRQLKRAGWALLGMAGVLAAFFRITAVELARFADPFGDHPPYSFTRLELVQPGPAGTNVLYGKGLVVRVKAFGHQPKDLFLTAFPPGHPEQGFTVPMFDKGKAGFDQLLDNIRSELVVYAHTKDRVSLSKQGHIGVVLTPQLEKAFVRISAPAYTGLKPEEKAYAFKGVQALAGSQVRFRLQSNRPLREGGLEITVGEQPAQRLRMTNSGPNEVAAEFVARDSGRLRFSVTDEAGLPSQGEHEGALTVTYDLPPDIRLVEPAHDSFVAMDFKLKLQVQASDDYGLKTLRLQRGLNGVYSAPRVVTYEGIVRDSQETQELDLAQLGIQPGDMLSFFAEAVDSAPEGHLARSQTVRLLVISVEDYNNYLREQSDIADAKAKYDELNNDLQELVEAQKQLGEAAGKLREQAAKADGKQKEALTQELDGLLAKQNELNQKLNRQAERMEHFVRDNPLYDVEQELQEALREQASAIRRSTQTNSAAARQVAQRSSPPGGPRQLSPELLEDFKNASDEQVRRLGGVHEQAQKEIAQTLEDMSQMQELIKDFNQFESLYRTQEELAQQAQAYNRAGQLSREDQLALKELAGVQRQVGALLKELTSKLREDAAAAEKLFPKAAKSGRELADKIQEVRLRPLAEQSTERMLAGEGQQSFQLAERLRGEMAKLFSDCQGGNCPGGNELDAYLKLQRLKAGNNFAQMSRSRKFGKADGANRGFGSGAGEAGTSGFAVADGTQMNVLGNESSARNRTATARQSSRQGKGAGQFAGNGAGTVEKPDVVKGLNPVNRQSGSVASENVAEEYSDVVENYFKTITTKKREP